LETKTFLPEDNKGKEIVDLVQLLLLGYKVTNHWQHVLKHPANTSSTQEHTVKAPYTASSPSGLEAILDLSPIFRSGKSHGGFS